MRATLEGLRAGVRARFPVIGRVSAADVVPPTTEVEEANEKSELLLELALRDLADTKAILSSLRTQAGIGLSALIGASAPRPFSGRL